MKALMILGAIVGFLLGAALGHLANNSWATTLWKACAAALAAALLARWWAGVWLRGLRESLENQQSNPTPAPKTPAKV